MKELNTISYFDMNDSENVLTKIQNMGYKIYYINGKSINSMEDLFLWIKDNLPQDPPISGNVNFDAFVDSLWGGLDGQNDDKVAIIWENLDELISKDKERFQILIQCLEEVARTLTLYEYGINKPIILKTVLLGKGVLYPKFED